MSPVLLRRAIACLLLAAAPAVASCDLIEGQRIAALVPAGSSPEADRKLLKQLLAGGLHAQAAASPSIEAVGSDSPPLLLVQAQWARELPVEYHCGIAATGAAGAGQEVLTIQAPFESVEALDGACFAFESPVSTAFLTLLASAKGAGLGIDLMSNTETVPAENSVGVIFASSTDTARFWFEGLRIDGVGGELALAEKQHMSVGPTTEHLLCWKTDRPTWSQQLAARFVEIPEAIQKLQRPPPTADSDNQAPVVLFGEPGDLPGQFREPDSVAIGPKGRVFVGDELHRAIQVYDPEGNWLFSFAKPGTGPGQFSGSVGGIAINGQGELFVTDPGNSRVQVFSIDGTFLRAFGALGMGPGQFFSPVGLAIGPRGNVFVSDDGRSDVQIFTPQGRFLRKLGSQGSGPGQFQGLESLAVDSRGFLYVADEVNRRIQVFDSQGRFIRVLLSANSQGAPVADLEGMAFDDRGRLWVLDEDAGLVRAFETDGTYLGAIGRGVGSQPGQMLSPDGLVFHPQLRRLYVVDELNLRVQAFSVDQMQIQAAEKRAQKHVVDRTLVLGRVGSPRQQIAKYLPLATYLASELSNDQQRWAGRVRPFATLAELQHALAAREVDLVVESSLGTLHLAKQGSLSLLVALGKNETVSYRSVVIVAADSPYQSPEDLRGRLVTFEDPGSTSAFLLPLGMLQQEGLRLRQLASVQERLDKNETGYLFAGDERTEAAWVFSGKVAAAGLSSIDLKRLGDLASRFRIVSQSPPVLHYLVSLRSDVDNSVADRLRTLLLQAPEVVAGRAALKPIKISFVRSLTTPNVATLLANSRRSYEHTPAEAWR